MKNACRGILVSALLWNVAAASQPNILFILADDVGSEVLECYGGESYRTPQLNRLAADGLRFTHAYAMPVCHPTRTTLLSGQYPARMGSPEWGTYPPDAERHTLAQVLKNAGYVTAIAGKWQLALLGEDPTHPHRLGFDQYALFGWHEGPRYYEPHIRRNGELLQDVAARYGPDVYCDFLIEFMNTPRSEPFFALYSMALCHDVTDDLDQPVPVGPQGRYQSFAEMVAAMDERVGRVVSAVDEAGNGNDTLIIFFTDNGSPRQTIVAAQGKELIRRPVVSQRDGVEVPGGKATLTDAGTRVPLLIRWKGRVEGGQTTDQLVDSSDFYPTLAEIVGATLPSDVEIDGQSFAGLLSGEREPSRQWVYAERKGKSFVKTQRWKLYNDGRYFNVEHDTEERRPLDAGKLEGEGYATRLTLLGALESLP